MQVCHFEYNVKLKISKYYFFLLPDVQNIIREWDNANEYFTFLYNC